MKTPGDTPVTLTASKLRENIYRILDEILETGIPVEIERKGRILRIVPAQPPKALDLVWTRDLFDRVIVGHASAADRDLLTRDELILANYPRACW
jgi:hypothetical protein